MLAADVTLEPSLSVSVPRVLFRFSDDLGDSFRWDVMPDGRAFVAIKDFSEPLSTLRMVQNWWTEVQAAFDLPGK